MQLTSKYNLFKDDPELAQKLPGKLADYLMEFVSEEKFCSGLAPEGDLFETSWFRIPEHFRSEYFKLSKDLTGSICLKGNTFLKENFIDYLKFYNQRKFRGGHLTIYERFPPLEHKVPGLLLKHEAWQELDMALKLHKNYQEVFGEFAPTTIPLALYKLENSSLEELKNQFDKVGNPNTNRLIHHLVEEGVYLLISYYAGVPYRAFDYHKKQIPADVLDNIKLNQTIESWLDNMAKMLHSGFLSGSLLSSGLGHPFDFGNLAIDGGYFDLGSLCELEHIADENYFLLNFSNIFKAFSISVANILKAKHEDNTDFVYKQALYHHFLSKIKKFNNAHSKCQRFIKNLEFDDFNELLAQWRLSKLINKS